LPLQTTIAGSLPKPGWLAEPGKLWAPWLLEGELLEEGKRDAMRLLLADQEAAGIDIVTDGEQTRRHFVTTFIESLKGVDFEHKRTVRIRNRYDADVPVVVGPVGRGKPVFVEDLRFLRRQTRRPIKLSLPGPMTMVDTLYDSHYHSREKLAREFAAILNQEARELERSEMPRLVGLAGPFRAKEFYLMRSEVKFGRTDENDIVAEVNKFLYTHGSDDVEAINAISGERCNPHPHNFTDRMIRPGDQAFFDILQSFMGYRTCYYRTFNVGRATPAQRDAYKKAREWLDNAMARIKPGASTAHICEVFPTADRFGFPDEMSAFGLQFAHGLGLALHERPIISRVVSLDHPTEIKEGMVFAIETYCPATDGYSAARIEEEVVVTDKGCRVISLFPAEELPIANAY